MAEQETHDHESHAHHPEHEAHEHHAEHEVHEHGAAPKPKDGNAVMWISLVIVVLVVAVVSYTAGTYASSNGNSGKQSVQTSPSVLNSSYGSQQPTTVQQTNMSLPVRVNVSVVKYFVLPSEAASLIGPGSYSAYAAETPAQVKTALSALLPSSPAYNVSAEYIISYNTSSTKALGGLQEMLLVSGQSGAVYSEGLNLYYNAFNKTLLDKNKNLTHVNVGINLTLSGMTYSFAEVSSTPIGANGVSQGFLMLGHTANVAVFAQVSELNATGPINATRVASIIAGHLS
jgi:hypothetical protein